jgi:SAM-dependent methyltransferase
MDDLPPTRYPQFRARRLGVADLGPVRVEVVVRVQGAEHPCALQDVSTSGAAFEWPEGLPVTTGMRLSDLAVICERQEVYRGDGRVHSLREVEGRLVAGVSFLDSPMNMDDVQQLREVRERRADPALVLRPEEQPWYNADDQTHRFEALVAELHLFLREAEGRFAALERTLPWHVLHGEKVTLARKALVEQLREGFVPSFVGYSRRIDAALRQAHHADQDHLKAFSRALLHDYFMRSPLMHRCLTKPLGYPGDYVVMRYLYEDHFEGTSLLAKAIHLAGVSTPACDAVRGRKERIFSEMCALARARAERGLRTRVISIAAGPAQETLELCERAPDLIPWLDVLLFDQDADALEYVNNRLALARARGHDLRVLLRHDTIRRLLDDEDIFGFFGPVDIIFACGLFDYLRFHTGVRLIRNLHRMLTPGGHVWIGNIVPEQPTRWIFDHHLDWLLEYRSREELLAMGEAAVPAGRPRIAEEASGFNPFVVLTRSA